MGASIQASNFCIHRRLQKQNAILQRRSSLLLPQYAIHHRKPFETIDKENLRNTHCTSGDTPENKKNRLLRLEK